MPFFQCLWVSLLAILARSIRPSVRRNIKLVSKKACQWPELRVQKRLLDGSRVTQWATLIKTQESITHTWGEQMQRHPYRSQQAQIKRSEGLSSHTLSRVHLNAPFLRRPQDLQHVSRMSHLQIWTNLATLWIPMSVSRNRAVLSTLKETAWFYTVISPGTIPCVRGELSSLAWRPLALISLSRRKPRRSRSNRFMVPSNAVILSKLDITRPLEAMVVPLKTATSKRWKKIRSNTVKTWPPQASGRVWLEIWPWWMPPLLTMLVTSMLSAKISSDQWWNDIMISTDH